jgi:hypothetical protein
LLKKSVGVVEGGILGFLRCFLKGVGEKWVDIDGFFVVKLWCFCGEVVVRCVVFLEG